MTLIVVDTCTLINFASVNRIELLERSLCGRGRWTEAVQWETKRAIQSHPELRSVVEKGFLGEAVEFSELSDQIKVDELRLALSAPGDSPTKNLGEAESIHAILSLPELAGAIFLTDDNAAADFGQQQRIRVWQTAQLLAEAHDSGEIGCPDAYQILCDMAHAGRGVYVPNTHHDVCP